MKTVQTKVEQVHHPAAARENTAPEGVFGIQDERPTATVQRKLGELANQRPAAAKAPVQRQENHTGLPSNLKTGIENLSGFSMDDVWVHRNSSAPAQLNAHAYAQGTDIHLGPGQEQHLPHEAWHVVQQKQGRVQPTRQLKGKVAINDDTGLEREADVMGNRALRAGGKEAGGTLVETQGGGFVAQLFTRKLKIGITGNQAPVGIGPENLPESTFVWLLTNAKQEQENLFGDESKSKLVKSSPGDIVVRNQATVNVPIYAGMRGKEGIPSRGIYQSGLFSVPRRGGGEAEGIDYSFLRFAAIKAYQAWYAFKGNTINWPDMMDPETLVESIDSDLSGITGDSTSKQAVAPGKWLAEAGSYEWDWTEVRNKEAVVNLFKGEDDAIDTTARDEALAKFAETYRKGEVEKRETAAAGNILNIYFPEPATRLSSDAIGLLNDAALANLAVNVGGPLGKGRESIGLIAALIFLDDAGSKKYKYKGKLKFNPSYVMKTGLGKRKNAFVTLFAGWYRKVSVEGADRNSVAVIESLGRSADFDQSYYDEGLPERVLKWHMNTIAEMEKSGAGDAFFNPKA